MKIQLRYEENNPVLINNEKQDNWQWYVPIIDEADLDDTLDLLEKRGVRNLSHEPVVEYPADLRKKAYHEMEIIEWQGEMMTVDNAVLLFSTYYAESLVDDRYYQLYVDFAKKIHEAKEQIRDMFPDKQDNELSGGRIK